MQQVCEGVRPLNLAQLAADNYLGTSGMEPVAPEGLHEMPRHFQFYLEPAILSQLL